MTKRRGSLTLRPEDDEKEGSLKLGFDDDIPYLSCSDLIRTSRSKNLAALIPGSPGLFLATLGPEDD